MAVASKIFSFELMHEKNEYMESRCRLLDLIDCSHFMDLLACDSSTFFIISHSNIPSWDSHSILSILLLLSMGSVSSVTTLVCKQHQLKYVVCVGVLEEKHMCQKSNGFKQTSN